MGITTTASKLGITAFNEANLIELRPKFTSEDAQVVVDAIYRQVLGNEYLMQSERQIELESLLTSGQLTVREFVSALAKSQIYKRKYLYPHFHTRVIELNFKHLLGRAPYNESEVIEHLDRYQNEGYEADIDSYIYSPEYETNFGESIVPYYRDLVTSGYNQRTVGFTNFFQLYRGYATSDLSQKKGSASRLSTDLALNNASAIIPPSVSEASKDNITKNNTFARNNTGANSSMYRIEVSGMKQPGYANVRRSNKQIFVEFEALSRTLQIISKQGGKVTSVTRA